MFAIPFVMLSAPSRAEAAMRMCALRSGPSGPCTCKSDKDGPGQFTVVSRSLCRKQAQDAAGDKKPVSPSASDAAAAPGQPAQDAPAAAAAAPAAAPADAPTAAAVNAAPAVPALAAGVSRGKKLEDIRARGKLLCGTNTGLIGFAAQSKTGSWVGLDADFCRAVAAAVFADAGKVEFVPVETNERFEALSTGKVDILARNTTWTMDRDVSLGLDFPGVLYFDGQGFLTSDERGLVSAQQLSGVTVCVEEGTTSQSNMAYYFKAHNVAAETQTFKTRDDMIKAYQSGACEAYSGDRSALYSDRASFADPAQHAILPEVISKEPLGPVVLQDDREWVEIVRWTLAALINAEETGLDRASAAASEPLAEDAMRLVEGAGKSGEQLRLSKTWLRDVIAATGNYGEMFENNLGKSSPLGMARGINALWKRGGILYAPPMW